MLHPVNRHILIEVPPTITASPDSLIMLPEDYKPEEEKFVEVKAMAVAEDVRFSIETPSRLIVDRSMIEEISIEGTIYNVILDNYVMGILK